MPLIRQIWSADCGLRALRDSSRLPACEGMSPPIPVPLGLTKKVLGSACDGFGVTQRRKRRVNRVGRVESYFFAGKFGNSREKLYLCVWLNEKISLLILR